MWDWFTAPNSSGGRRILQPDLALGARAKSSALISGDQWADPVGEFLAEVAAGPVYRLLNRHDLGTDKLPPVGTPLIEETYQPDAFRMQPFDWGRNDECRMTNDESHPRIALRRFRPPTNAAIFISADRHLQSDNVRGQIIEQRGPYLFSGNWWDEKSWARAEWDLQLKNGEVVRCHESEGTWKIDGIYD